MGDDFYDFFPLTTNTQGISHWEKSVFQLNIKFRKPAGFPEPIFTDSSFVVTPDSQSLMTLNSFSSLSGSLGKLVVYVCGSLCGAAAQTPTKETPLI
jgi:hypothetical protein